MYKLLLLSVLALAPFAATANIPTDGADFSPALTLDGPIVGLCVLALAEVIRHGQRLRQELDEVI